jgi:hypothetical protein
MIEIVPLTPELAPAVRDFNAIMKQAGFSALPETPQSVWLPPTKEGSLFEECFVAVEDGHVRGGYAASRHQAWVGGETRPVSYMRLPVSEAVVNRKYSLVPARLVKDALARHPLTFGMGMGGDEVPVARLLKAMKFRVEPVPFYFKIHRAARFLTGSHVMNPWLAKSAAYSGGAWAAKHALDLALVRDRALERRLRVEVVPDFRDWADELWDNAKEKYTWVAGRDSQAMNAIYPTRERSYIRLKVWDGARLAGWAILLDMHLKDDKRFGRVRAGQIVDCFGAPDEAAAVMRGACRFLEDRGVDFIRSHQSHPAWCKALRNSGFLQGSSYFLYGHAPAISEILDRVDPQQLGVHLNRGDGDSPLYLPRRGTPAGAYPIHQPPSKILEKTPTSISDSPR